MTIYDDAASALLAAVPSGNRRACIAPIVRTTIEAGAPGTGSFTLWVDLGSGPVKAAAARTVLNSIYALDPSVSILGQRAIVLFVAGSPVVIDLLGYISIAVP